MTRYCPVPGCTTPITDADPFCPEHLEPLRTAFDSPETSVPPEPIDEPEPLPPRPAVCWNCGTVPAGADNVTCMVCGRSLTPPALVIRFADGQVEVDRAARVELGRLGEHARLFRAFLNVSRRHAVVGVEPDGHPWIEPIPTPNGTFVNDVEVPHSRRHRLQTGNRIRFGLHASGTVTTFPSTEER
jgi:hypothetical protein